VLLEFQGEFAENPTVDVLVADNMNLHGSRSDGAGDGGDVPVTFSSRQGGF
jgi:hypothetical protein